MDGVSFARVREVFETALDRPAAQRAAFVTACCGADTALRAEVERLLVLHEADERPGAPSPPGPGELAAALAGALPLAPGTRLGTWRLLRVLGSGGMGEVWEAEQEQPRRRAAVKVMRAGPASARARARFRDEIDALARLQHPGIARILEAGDQTSGASTRLWYAMELVPGARPLSDWLAGRRLPWPQAVALVRALCEAVEHGHRHGVIHRDLKPGNVLVGEDGRPRVIDFGVARITEQGSALAARTQAGELVGTLASMAPEQLDGRADVRSDIYGLGMLLHELLAGRPPYDVEGLSLTEAARRVREVVPPPPGASRPGLPVELDWITGRALEKDPELRYASVQAFSEDLRRLLHDEPVLAGAPGRGYRLRKFVRRHRVGVGLAALILLLLVGGIAGTTTGLLRAVAKEHEAQHARGVAEDSAREAQAVTQFLVDVFGTSDPALDGNEARVVDALDRAEARMADFLREFPRAEVRLRTALGTLDVELGRYGPAEVQLRRALELRRAQAAAPPLAAGAGASVGTAFETAEDNEEAIALLRRELGVVLAGVRRFPEADAELEGALDTLRARHGGAHASLPVTLSALAGLRHREGRMEDAERAYAEALAISRALHGPQHVDTARVEANFAGLLMDLRRFDEAEPLLVEALDTLRRERGSGDPLTLTCLSNLAGVRHQQERWDEAAALMDEALAARRGRYPEGHPVLLAMEGNLATLRFKQGRPAEATRLMEAVLAARLRTDPPHDPDLITMLCNLGSFAHAQGDDDAVRAVVDRLLAAQVATQAPDPRSAFWLENFARFLELWRLTDEALALLDEAAIAHARLQPPGDADALTGRAFRARVLVPLGRHDEARAELEAVGEQALSSLAADDPRRGLLDLDLARGWVRLKELARAEALLRETVAILEPRGDHPDLRIALQQLADMAAASGRQDEAAQWRQRLAALSRDEASP